MQTEKVKMLKEVMKEEKKRYENLPLISCICGSHVKKSYYNEHRKTQKHIKWVDSQNA